MPRPSWVSPPAVDTADYTESIRENVESGLATPTGSFLRTHTMARFLFETDATEIDLDYYVDNATLAEGVLGVYVPSVDTWVATTTPGATGAQTQTVAIPGSGVRDVWVVNGMRRSSPGAWLTGAAAVDGTVFRRKALPSNAGKKALILYHDSIPEQVASGIIHEECTIGILRATLSDTVVYCEGYGGRGIVSDYGDGYAALTASIRAAAYASGVAPADVVVCIQNGTNDFNGSWATVAAFQTQYQNLITAIRARLPSAAIYCTTLIPRSSETNGFGDTATEYRTAISDAEAAAGDANTFVIDGTALIDSVGTDLVDGVHLRNGPTVGHPKYAARLAAAMGLT
jgi:hypothetical protein